MKGKNNLKYTKKTVLGVVVISFMMLSFTMGLILNEMAFNDATLEEAIETTTKKWILSATDLDPGNGECGIVNAYIYPHSASSVYNSALLEANAFEHFDAVFVEGEELEGETPFNTPVDMCVEYQFNDTAYNTTSADWDITLVKAFWNETQLSVASQLSEKSTDFFDQDGTTDAKINFYLLDADGGAGSGFTIGQLEQIDDTQIKVYYYG